MESLGQIWAEPNSQPKSATNSVRAPGHIKYAGSQDGGRDSRRRRLPAVRDASREGLYVQDVGQGLLLAVELHEGCGGALGRDSKAAQAT